MTTWTGTIALTEDDAGYSAGVVDPALITRSLSTSSNNYAFFRFRNVPIPQGATIISATLQADWLFFSSGQGVMRPMLRDNVPVPLTPDLIAPLGTASPPYNATTGMVQSVAAGLQEVVDRPGWAAGNAVGFVAERYAGTVSVRMLNTDGIQYAAVLTVEYAEPGEPPGIRLAELEVSTEGALPRVQLMELQAFTDAPEPVAGPAKWWTGDQWAEATPHVWSGDQWVPVQPYVWTGDQWVPTS